MKDSGRLLWLATGLVLGVIGAALYLGQWQPVQAANDRYEDYVMCTGTVAGSPGNRYHGGSQFDGVWLLDYRSGKLLATAVDRLQGKVIGWAELDLTKEFNVIPRQNVHFLMTTGQLNYAQSALYVAETGTGAFGVYTMGLRTDGQAGIVINRQDLTKFRK